MAREIPTFYDAVFAVTQFAARRGVGISGNDARAAVIDAYVELSERHSWAYAKKIDRVHVEEPLDTGTVEYTASTRTLTLTGSTWPTDVTDFVVIIDNVTYRVESYTSTTEIVLDSDQAPVDDIAAGETYEMYRMYYLLPDDFISCVDPMPQQDSDILGVWSSPAEIMAAFRYDTASASSRLWSIAPVPDKPNRYALWLYPANSNDDTIDVYYRAFPRQLRFSGYEKNSFTGNVSVTAASAVVTGSSTAFEDAMEGSVFRICSDTTFQPTGLRGTNPWSEEARIKTYTSATSITLYDAIVTARTNVKYTVTDPLDVDPIAIPALFRIAERNISELLGGKEVERDNFRAERAIMAARGAANKTAERLRVAGETVQSVRSLEHTFEFDDGGLV